MPSPTRTIARSACRLIRTAHRLGGVAAELRAAGYMTDAETIRLKATDLAAIGRKINGRASLEAQMALIAQAIAGHDRRAQA
jgi:hypothetical protein